MKRRNAIAAASVSLSIAAWSVVAWSVAAGFGFLGPVTLRWPGVWRPTAWFAWGAGYGDALDRKGGTTVIPRGRTVFAVTRPSDFESGIVRVTFAGGVQETAIMTAETRTGRELASATAAGGRELVLTVDWSELVAYGRTFRFAIETPVPQFIQSIDVQVRP